MKHRILLVLVALKAISSGDDDICALLVARDALSGCLSGYPWRKDLRNNRLL